MARTDADGQDTDPQLENALGNGAAAGEEAAPDSSVENPAELIRIGSMVQALRQEVDRLSLDEAGRRRLLEIHRQAVDAIKGIVSEDLEAELSDLSLPLGEGDATPGEAEIRLAQAQLGGWLEGLFRGLQAAMASRQMAQMQPGGRQGALQAPQEQPSGGGQSGPYL